MVSTPRGSVEGDLGVVAAGGGGDGVTDGDAGGLGDGLAVGSDLDLGEGGDVAAGRDEGDARVAAHHADLPARCGVVLADAEGPAGGGGVRHGDAAVGLAVAGDGHEPL